MLVYDVPLPWLHAVTVSDAGIVMTASEGCGVGAVLMIEHARTGALLMARKSARLGFAGNDQLAFPGGMVRAQTPQHTLSEWISRSLHDRVAAEVQLDLASCDPVLMCTVNPPIVAAYMAKGHGRHTVLVPFTLTVPSDFQPSTQDPTVYAPGWYDSRQLWLEITPTNRLLAAYFLWPRLTVSERAVAQPSVAEAVAQASDWAAACGFSTPIAPWDRMNSGACSSRSVA